MPQGANPEIIWSSSNYAVIDTTTYGMITSVGTGTAILTAQTAGYDTTGAQTIRRIPIRVIYTAAQNPGYTLSDPNVQTAQAATSGGGAAGGGGGGCNAGIFGGALLLLVAGAFAARKLKAIFFSLLMILIMVTAANAAFTPTLDKIILQIVKNQTTPATLTASPTGAASYTWTSGNTSVVTLTSAGANTATISGVGAGTTVISCDVLSSDNTSTGTATCVITVFETGMSGVTLNPTVATWLLRVSSPNKPFNPVYTPAGAAPISFTWESSAPNTVSIDANGNIEGLVKGSATITYKAMAVPAGGGDPREFQATATVNVVQPVLSMDITPKGSFTSVADTGLSLTVRTYPADADNTDIVWTFPNPTVTPSIATLTPAADTLNASFKAVSFPGQNIYPLANLPITYNSNIKNPIRVVATLKNWGAGVANIWTDSCDVIINPVEIGTVTVTPATVTLNNAQPNAVLTATVSPLTATMTSADWTSTNPTAIFIGSTNALINTVRGLLPGNANVSYTFSGWKINTTDYTHTPSFISGLSAVTAVSPPPNVGVVQVNIIEPDVDIAMTAGQSRQFVAQVLPYDASNKNLTWTSSNPLAATVSGSGFVTAHYAGIATITASSVANSTKSASRTIVVTTSPSVVTNPSTVGTSGVQGSITTGNVPLVQKGCEVNFGFATTNKPNISGGTIIENITTAPEIKEAAQPQVSGVIGSSGQFELKNVTQGSYVPVSLKFTITEQDIFRYIGGDTSYIRAIIENPYQYLETLFGVFSIQKQIIDPNPTNNMIALIPKVLSARAAVNAGILFLNGLGNKIEVTLNYYVGDSANTTAAFIDGNLVVGDGAANGVIRDPVWVVATKPPVNNSGSASSSSSGGGGGCNAVGVVGVILLVAVPFVIRKTRAM